MPAPAGALSLLILFHFLVRLSRSRCFGRVGRRLGRRLGRCCRIRTARRCRRSCRSTGRGVRRGCRLRRCCRGCRSCAARGGRGWCGRRGIRSKRDCSSNEDWPASHMHVLSLGMPRSKNCAATKLCRLTRPFATSRCSRRIVGGNVGQDSLDRPPARHSRSGSQIFTRPRRAIRRAGLAVAFQRR
jgi:hypothetical protein